MSTFTNLLFHVVYSTKFRKASIDEAWQDQLYGFIGGVVRENKGVLLCVGGVHDHVHLLVKLSPVIAISDAIRSIKANSSRMVNEQIAPRNTFEWQTGYGAFSVSESQKDKVYAYIQNQQEHHRKLSFQEEFLQLLERHQIQYDPRYVFEQEIIE